MAEYLQFIAFLPLASAYSHHPLNNSFALARMEII